MSLTDQSTVMREKKVVGGTLFEEVEQFQLTNERIIIKSWQWFSHVLNA